MDKDIKKTKLFIQSMEVGAAGWVQGKNTEAHPGPYVYVYIIDRPGPDAWVWMASCIPESFVTISTDTSTKKDEWKQYRNALSTCIKNAAEGHPNAETEGEFGKLDWEEQLALCASAYAGTTKTWEIGKKLAGGGHFIVLNYRAKGAVTGNLRPFAITEASTILNAAELIGMAMNVMETDMKNHPEWFPKEK